MGEEEMEEEEGKRAKEEEIKGRAPKRSMIVFFDSRHSLFNLKKNDYLPKFADICRYLPICRRFVDYLPI